MTSDLAGMLALADVILYDFDGPICDVFSRYPAHSIARQIERLAGRVFDTNDPLDILEFCDGSDVLQAVEDALISAEVVAVGSADPTPGGLESISTALAVGKRVGVVSNNSSAAVEHFLLRVGLSEAIWPVVGRAYLLPARMKPHPWPLSAALTALEAPPGRALFVGDSFTDIEAARKADVPCLAYANKPGKRENFIATGAMVIDSMWELRNAIELLEAR